MYKLCIDTTGSASSIEQVEPLPRSQLGISNHEVPLSFFEHYRDALRRWKFTPYTIRGQIVPVCTAIMFSYILNP